MKKFIIAALSILVGSFGYTIVDTALETRVAVLESEMQVVREEVSRYHQARPTHTTDPNAEPTTNIVEIPSYTPPSEGGTYPMGGYESLYVGRRFTKLSNSQSKFLIVVKENGHFDYIAPDKYQEYLSPTTTQPFVSTNPYDTTEPDWFDSRVTSALAHRNYVGERTTVAELEDPRGTTITTEAYPNIETTTAKPQPTDAPIIAPAGEYFVYLTDVSAIVTDVKYDTNYSYNYDNDYSLVSAPSYENCSYTFTIKYKGYTDPSLTRNSITFNPYFEMDYQEIGIEKITLSNLRYATLISRSNNIIGSDGKFEYTETYLVQTYRNLFPINPDQVRDLGFSIRSLTLQ